MSEAKTTSEVLLELTTRMNLLGIVHKPIHSLQRVKEHLRVLMEAIIKISEITESNISSFCKIHDLTDIIKLATCFEYPSNPSCIDLFLNSNGNCFQKSLVF